MSVPIATIPVEKLKNATYCFGLQADTNTWLRLHTGLLDAHEAFSAACINKSHEFCELLYVNEGKECQSHYLILKLKDVACFRQLVSWLYCGSFVLKKVLDEDDEQTREDYQLELVKLYIFARRLLFTKLENDIISTFYELDVQTSFSVINELYAENMTSCELFNLVVDDLACEILSGSSDYCSKGTLLPVWKQKLNNHPNFAMKLLDAIVRHQLRQAKRTKVKNYHIDSSGQRVSKKSSGSMDEGVVEDSIDQEESVSME